MFEQLFIEAGQPFRSVEKRLLHLAERVHRFVYRFVLCQPAPFSAKLRQSGADGIHAGGADIRVQQAIGPQSADLMAFFCCFRDGPVDGQHLRMILPQDRVQRVQLPEGRGQNDVRVAFEPVVHPQEGGMDLRFRDASYRAVRGVAVVGSTDPGHISVLAASALKHRPAVSANDF